MLPVTLPVGSISDLRSLRWACLAIASLLSPFHLLISTHHAHFRGSKLALLSDRKVFKPDVIDPISRLTGVGLRPFHEFTPENMKNFNYFVQDVEGV